MLVTLAYATLLTAIFATIAAVARDVPILEAFGARRTVAGKWAALIVGGPGIVACALHLWTDAKWFGFDPLAIVWPPVLVYFWWTIAWRLRQPA